MSIDVHLTTYSTVDALFTSLATSISSSFSVRTMDRFVVFKTPQELRTAIPLVENALKLHNLSLQYETLPKSKDAEHNYLFKDDKNVVNLRFSNNNESGWYHIRGVFSDLELADLLHKMCWQEPSASKTIPFHLIARAATGFTLIKKDLPEIPLIKDNYNEDVLMNIEAAIDDLKRDDPSGRLLILEGAPGTGKTYLVRTLAASLPSFKFLVVDPALMAELVGPNLVSLLSGQIETGVKLVLVVEDADNALVPRDGGNMGLISSVLNMTSGLYGQMFDLRIIATTNQRIKNIDQALLRPGRLCGHIHVPALTADKAQAVWERESKQHTKYDGKLSLADVYKAANDHNRAVKTADQKTPNKVGFGF